MENIINDRDTQIVSGRIFSGYKSYEENQFEDYGIERKSNESRIIKRRKLKGKIRITMNTIR